MEILILFMPIFIKWIEKCQEDRNRNDIEAGLNNPGLRERFGIWLVFRRNTELRRKALRLEVEDAMAGLRDMEPEDIQAFMAAVPLLPQS